jgi:hypothetical protein
VTWRRCLLFYLAWVSSRCEFKWILFNHCCFLANNWKLDQNWSFGAFKHLWSSRPWFSLSCTNADRLFIWHDSNISFSCITSLWSKTIVSRWKTRKTLVGNFLKQLFFCKENNSHRGLFVEWWRLTLVLTATPHENKARTRLPDHNFFQHQLFHSFLLVFWQLMQSFHLFLNIHSVFNDKIWFKSLTSAIFAFVYFFPRYGCSSVTDISKANSIRHFFDHTIWSDIFIQLWDKTDQSGIFGFCKISQTGANYDLLF